MATYIRRCYRRCLHRLNHTRLVWSLARRNERHTWRILASKVLQFPPCFNWTEPQTVLFRAFALADSNSQYASSADNLEINSLDKSPVVQSDVQDALKQNIPTQKPKTAKARYSRTITPFIAAHDIPRGILYSLQVFMMYLLMMAVMCV